MLLPLPRVHPGRNDAPPEIQYQRELYRGLSDVVDEAVLMLPYSASPNIEPGRIDFYVPKMKWGIEIIQDGSCLAERNSRFKTKGDYGSWLNSLDMLDYILLDFRQNMPNERHPGIPNLYHVVFTEMFSEFTIYNSNLDVVRPTRSLSENS
ncbi:hypothetical protein BD410DRAFT_733647 [Rickenella mellea]|uniref:Uncharacterized protein n=1 Tax=Rickenella mellea TaxID=50990 RepID=A0A4Y7PH35_9AGAM|nr:hypothetical protein BD410DRAFT_733647 [Rickenella mellea]